MLRQILFKDFGDVKSNLICFCLFGVLGVLYLFSLDAENAINGSDIALILFLQVMITTTFTNFRVASLKKDFMKQFGNENSLQNSKEPRIAMTYLKIAYLVIMGLVILGVVWYMVHKNIWLPLENYNNG